MTNGLCIQWGTYDNGSLAQSIRETVTFPIVFTGKPHLILTNGRTDDSSSYDTSFCNYTYLTTTRFKFISWDSANKMRYISWLAIGY